MAELKAFDIADPTTGETHMRWSDVSGTDARDSGSSHAIDVAMCVIRGRDGGRKLNRKSRLS